MISTTTFTITGTATDDVGVNSVSLTLRDGQNRYLQDDGTVSGTYNTFRVTPDVVGALSTTWSYEVTVPTEESGGPRPGPPTPRVSPTWTRRTGSWIVSSTGSRTVGVDQPTGDMLPPTAAQPVTVAPGSPITFAGSATDDEALHDGRDLAAQQHDAVSSWPPTARGGPTASPAGTGSRRPTWTGPAYNWSYTTPFNLQPGQLHVLRPCGGQPRADHLDHQPGPADDQRSDPG